MAVPTTWANLPLPETGSIAIDAVTQWEWDYQFDRAFQERMPIFCGYYWPPTTHIWSPEFAEPGVISSITNTTLTDAARIPADNGSGGNANPSWATDDAGIEAGYESWVASMPKQCDHTHAQWWNGWCACDPDGIYPCWKAWPEHCDVVVGGDFHTQPWLCKQTRISSNGAFTLRFGDLGLTSAELDNLVGKRYYILRSDGLAWHNRVIYANPNTLCKNHGGGTSLTANGDGTYTITDVFASWATNQYAHKKVAFKSSVLGGYVRFGEVISNTEHKFIFSVPSPYVPSGSQYAIMESASPDHYSFDLQETKPHLWQTQLGNTYYTKNEGIVAAGIDTVSPKVSLEVANAACDGTEFKPCFDIDFKTDFDDACAELGEAPANKVDNFASPDFYKSWRGKQAFAERWCYNWLPPYENVANAVITFTPATLFHHCGINSFTGNCANDAIHHPLKFGLGTVTTGMHDATPLYYTIMWRDRKLVHGVKLVADGEDVWVDYTGANDLDLCSRLRYESATFVASLGWTRFAQRHHRFMYDRHYFLPEIDTETDLPIPPSPANPGQWHHRPPSTCYAKTDDNYIPDDSYCSHTIGATIDSTETFVDGELSRYMGDNRQGPATDMDADHTDEMEADWQVKGQHEGYTPKANFGGAITAVGTGWIRDAQQSWTYGEWSGFQATATDGSSTTIVCDTVVPVYDGDGELVSGDLRWDSLTNRWVDFIVEPTNGHCKGYKMPITAFDDVTHTITFAIPNFFWTFATKKITATNVGVGDIFKLVIDADTFTYTADTTSAAEVAAGLAALVTTTGMRAYVDGNDLVLEYATTATPTITPSTTDGDGITTQTLTVTSTIASTKVDFHIHEPRYMLNRWEGRQVKVSKVDGTLRGTGTITHSDNDTLWITGLTGCIASDTYEIIEKTPGTVWQRSGSSWIVPTSCPSGESDQLIEKPTIKKRYGRLYKYDYLTAVNINELYRVIKSYVDTLGSYTWTANGELNQIGTPDEDAYYRPDGDTYSVDDPIGATLGALAHDWDFDNPDNEYELSSHDGAPFCSFYLALNNLYDLPGSLECEGYASGRWSYAKMNPQCCPLACTIDFWVFASWYLNEGARTMLTWDVSDPNIATHSNGYCDDGDHDRWYSFTNDITITVPPNPLAGSPGSFAADGGTIDRTYVYDSEGDAVLTNLATDGVTGKTSYSREETKYYNGIDLSYNKWSKLGTYSGHGNDTAIISGKMGPTSLPAIEVPDTGGGDVWNQVIYQGYAVFDTTAIIHWGPGLNFK